MKKFFIFLFIMFTFVFLAVFGIFYVDRLLTENEVKIEEITTNSFEDCIKAEGSVVLESYPAQCKTKNGQSFIQDIGNELELQNIIRVFYPRPADIISSPLVITGEARGLWYFEASFPIVLVNWDGLIIAQGIATAQGEWMTTDFVPFEETIQFTKPDYGERGALIFQKDNRSVLQENDDSLEIPIRFK